MKTLIHFLACLLAIVAFGLLFWCGILHLVSLPREVIQLGLLGLLAMTFAGVLYTVVENWNK